jgi:GTP-binding protein
VGKSTLVNALLGEERVVVFDEPGTTRDSIRVTLERRGRRYALIDTAGVRRRARISDTVEKFSVVKALQAVEAANVVILLLDARSGITEQDAMLAGFVLECGRSVVLAVNKWDGLDPAQRTRIKNELHRKMAFLQFARVHYISARRATGIADLFASVDRAFASAHKILRTPRLNRVLQGAVQASAPPRARGGPVRLKYAHQAGKNPPLVVIHGTRVDAVPPSYRRYLSKAVRVGFGLEGTPVQIELRAAENPFAPQARQRAKRRENKGKAPGKRHAR